MMMLNGAFTKSGENAVWSGLSVASGGLVSGGKERKETGLNN